MSDKSIMFKLSVMMFLQFFIWGAWYTSVSNFMQEQGMKDGIYWVFTAGPLGAIIAPFFLGLIADRFFNTEKVLSILFLLSGISIFVLPNYADQGADTVNNIILLHMLFYMPTLALSASLSFTHLKDAPKQFPIVRVLGTIGWIVAGIVVSVLKADTTATQFTVAGVASIALGLFCLCLPKTPPPLKEKKVEIKDLFFADSWKLMKNPSFCVFAIISALVCIPLSAYYAYSQLQLGQLGITAVAATKTMGQGSEIIFMVLMPFFFRKLGIKWIIAIGILAWAVRYLLFALAVEPSLISLFYIGLLLHGVCYDFFFVAGQVYVNNVAGAKIRAQAQSLIVFLTQGVGLYFGAIVAGNLFKKANPTGANINAWADFWYPLMWMSLILFIVFVLAFHLKKDEIKDVSH